MRSKRAAGTMYGLCIALILLVSVHYAGAQVESVQVRGEIREGEGVWGAHNFGWFYYDPDLDLGEESLKVMPEGRLVEKGDLTYASRTWFQKFEDEDMGSYQAVAFLGKEYLAGYPESLFTDKVSSLEKGELREILWDRDIEVVFTAERPLPLAEGYLLALGGASDKGEEVHLLLFKYNRLVDEAVVRSGEDYVYKINDLPIILVRISQAMGGRNSSFVQAEGIFQVTEEPTLRIRQGQRLGNMEITDISESGIELKNYNSLSMIPDSVVPLVVGNLFLRVAEGESLRYYPVGIYSGYGPYPLTGRIYAGNNTTSFQILGRPTTVEAAWTSQSFPGFYYDDEKDIGREELTLNKTLGRTLPHVDIRSEKGSPEVDIEGVLYYSTVQPVEFERKEWGSYNAISLFGQLWFAGYGPNTNPVIGSKSTLEYGQLEKKLIDTDQTDVAVAGTIFSFQDGYSLFIPEVGNNSIFIHLLKDGKLVDNTTVNADTTYVYKRDVGDVKDLPIIAFHIGAVFRNETQQAAMIEGLFQLSDQIYLPVEFGNEFGKLAVIGITENYIMLANDEPINLNRDSSVNLWPEIPGLWKGLNIRIADNETLRYFPYVLEYVVPPPQISDLAVPKEVPPRGQANFALELLAGEVQSVIAEISDPKGRLVSSKDLTPFGRVPPERIDRWGCSWQWNATVSMLSDDGMMVPDVGVILPVAVIYLNSSSQPVPVLIKFDSSGRIAWISDLQGESYYISPSEFEQSGGSFNQMLNNSTLRQELIKVVPGASMLRFFTYSNDQAINETNHTLGGSLEELEPHLIRVPAPPGKYELIIRATNTMKSLVARGFSFNVSGNQTGANPENFFKNYISPTKSKEGSNSTAGHAEKTPAVGVFISVLSLSLVYFWGKSRKLRKGRGLA